jgi:N-acetylglucosamine-6-sulfatase
MIHRIPFALAAALALFAPAASARQPNIVVIMTDDMAAGDLGNMSQTRDFLADRGVTFTNSFVNFPLCAPSRTSFLTGQAAHNHGVTDNGPPDGGYGAFARREDRNLGTWMQAAGYRTGFLGKFLNGYAGPGTHVVPGWDDWRVFLWDHSKYYQNYTLVENGAFVTYGNGAEDYSTDVLGSFAARFIRRAAGGERPFLLVVEPYAPHSPSTPAPRHEGAWADAPLPMSPAFNEADISDKPPSVHRGIIGAEGITRMTDQYRDRQESLMAVDDMVGDIVEELRTAGVLSNTYVIFTSDNGFLLGDHRRIAKRVAYDGAIRVPLVIRGPGVPEGVKRAQLVTSLDLPATILDLADATATNPLDGASLMPLLSGVHPPWRSAIGIEGSFNVRDRGNVRWFGVRTGDGMFAEYLVPEGRESESYDTIIDPFELDATLPSRLYNRELRDISRRLMDCAGASCWYDGAVP